MDSLSAISTIMAEISSSISTAQQQISAIPFHPYEAAKAMLFENDYKFPTIEDIVVPEEITPEGLVDKITQMQKQYQNVLIDYISNPSLYTVEGFSNHLSPLAELSGANTFVVTPEKYKEYIKFLEVLQSINLNDITKDSSKETIKKIGYSLVSCLNRKTINI